MTRILLVDDHPVVRQGIKQVLAGAFHPALVGEASNAEEGMTEIKSTEWDVMVLDLSLPGTSGLDLLKDLRRERPTLPVLVLSMHPPDQFARRAMNAGASGYLTKDSNPTELVKAVGEVIAGRRYLNPTVIEELVSNLQPERGQRPHEALSDREVSGAAHDRVGPDRVAGGGAPVAQREDRQHVSRARARKDEHEDDGRADALRHPARPGRLPAS